MTSDAAKTDAPKGDTQDAAPQTPARSAPAPQPAAARPPAKPVPAKAQLAAVPVPKPAQTRPAVREPGPARFRARHWILALSFLVLVLIPGILGVGYLYTYAANQYHSTVGFSVHSEEGSSPLDILGSITQSSKSSASDADILYEYIRSQQMVEEVGSELDLVTMFNRPDEDPLFTLGESPTIEDLHWYWGWMVSVAYDGGTGIIEVEARAFTPEDAHAIAEVIVRRSTELINALSQEAREDAIRFAEQDLTEAENRLRDIRRKLRAFRDVEQIIDPTADVEQRMGLLTALEQQLAEALVSRDVLLGYSSTADSRVRKLEDQIAAIERQIEQEKAKLGTGSAETGVNAERMAEIVGTFEELVMDREFAQQAYQAVLASYEEARAEARRQHRYLATHVGPTLSEEALYPRRWLLGPAWVLFLVMGWLVMVLILFNVRDSR
jgi:capsular polysaccharide transport system permease protein